MSVPIINKGTFVTVCVVTYRLKFDANSENVFRAHHSCSVHCESL